MTTRNLDALFALRAIALIGASNAPHSVGAVLGRDRMESGFAGPVMIVKLRSSPASVFTRAHSPANATTSPRSRWK